MNETEARTVEKRPAIVGRPWQDGLDDPDAPSRVYVPQENMDDLRKAIAKLAKRAIKLGLEPATLTVGEVVVVPGAVRASDAGPYRTPDRVLYEVEVRGPQVRIAGWEFVARIEHGAGGNLLKAVPTAELGACELAAYRDAADWCDHCSKARNRKDTFVVRATGTGAEAKGTLRQIGRNCLKDFLGHEAPEQLARLAQYLAEVLACGSEDPDASGFGLRAPNAFSVRDYLAACQGYVQQDGWLSRSKARESMAAATADCAMGYLVAVAIGDAKPLVRLERDSSADWEAYYEVADTTFERGLALLESKEAAGVLSDYEHNLLISIRSKVVTDKTAGYAGSLLGYVRRADEKAVAKAGFGAVAAGSQHFGSLKERLRGVEATILRMVSIDGYYGGVEIVSFVTADGNLGVCFCSGDVNWAKIGKTYKLDMTVKAHNVNTRTGEAYDETQVQRMKVSK